MGCDLNGGDEAHEGGISSNVDDVIDSDAKGHRYSFSEPTIDCTKENNTDNRAYLAFYITTMVTALIGLCCLFGETGEKIYGGCLVFLFLWANFAYTALYLLDLQLNFSTSLAANLLVLAYEQSSSSKRQSFKCKAQRGTTF